MKECFLTIGFFSAGAGAADAGGAFLARHRSPVPALGEVEL